MDTIKSEEKIVWSNGMIAIAEKHGLRTIEGSASNRDLC